MNTNNKIKRTVKQKEKWFLALCQHPMFLLVKDDDECLERTAGWGGDFHEHLNRLKCNLDAVEKYEEVKVNFDFAAMELELVKLHRPELIKKIRKLVRKKKVAFVNGTYSQPHLQILPPASCWWQFKYGLELIKKLTGQQVKIYATQESGWIEQLPQILNHFGYISAVPSHFAWNMEFLTPHKLLGYRGRLNSMEVMPFTSYTAPDGTSIPLYLADVGGPLNAGISDESLFWEYQKDKFKAPVMKVLYPDMININNSWINKNLKNGEFVNIESFLENKLKNTDIKSKVKLYSNYTYSSEGYDGQRLQTLYQNVENLLVWIEACGNIIDKPVKGIVEKHRKILLDSQHHDALWPGGPVLKKKQRIKLENSERELLFFRNNFIKSVTGKADKKQIAVIHPLPTKFSGVVKVNVTRDNNSIDHPIEKRNFITKKVNLKSAGMYSFKDEDKGEVSVSKLNKINKFKTDFFNLEITSDLRIKSLKCDNKKIINSDSNVISGVLPNGEEFILHNHLCDTKIQQLNDYTLISAFYKFKKGKAYATVEFHKNSPFIDFNFSFDFNNFAIGDCWKDDAKMNLFWNFNKVKAIKYSTPFSSQSADFNEPVIPSAYISSQLDCGKTVNLFSKHHARANINESGKLSYILAWGKKTRWFNSHVYGAMDYGKVFDLQLDGVFNYSFRLSLDNSNLDKQTVDWNMPPLAAVVENEIKTKKCGTALPENIIPIWINGDEMLVYESSGKKTKFAGKIFQPKGIGLMGN